MGPHDEVHRITDASPGLTEDQNGRVRRYLISMGIRTACFIGAIVVDGWFRWVLAAGAVVLPYTSVVIANAGRESGRKSGPPPMIIMDTAQLPAGHPDRTEPRPPPASP